MAAIVGAGLARDRAQGALQQSARELTMPLAPEATNTGIFSSPERFL